MILNCKKILEAVLVYLHQQHTTIKQQRNHQQIYFALRKLSPGKPNFVYKYFFSTIKVLFYFFPIISSSKLIKKGFGFQTIGKGINHTCTRKGTVQNITDLILSKVRPAHENFGFKLKSNMYHKNPSKILSILIIFSYYNNFFFMGKFKIAHHKQFVMFFGFSN